ncbi:hypothetical protein DPMN_178198 [Dreissena polymorpha]|uniref:Uncharacterized protein n=1 Tax=Dreissena polymorpha TaxID=45954 RepID=A0A9D4IIG4_DREPO|nr:hypothetical protein DPMN_178198 [Dreissena polymorpha]
MCSITRKTAPPPCGHFHDDWANNVTSRTRTIFSLNFRIKETIVLTKFHEHWAKNVTSREFTCFHYIHIEKNAQPTGGHVFPPIWTIFELTQDINKTNVLTNFHDDWAKIVTSRVFTRKTAPPTGSHVFQRTRTTFELNKHIIKANILTKFHENWAKNVISRVHVFSPIWTIFELVRDINKTNVLTNFHDDWAKIVTYRVFTMENCHYIHIEKNAPPTGGHVFSLILTIFKLVRDINKINILTNFHDDRAKIVTSRVFTRFLYSKIGKTAPPTGSHVFQWTQTTFELNQHIIKANILTNFDLDQDFIGTKLLTKFHEDWTRNVASRVFTDKC